MPLDESARMIFVADQRVEAGAGGEVAIDIRIIAQVAIRDAAGRYLAFGIEDGLVGMVFINVGPPGLRMSEKDCARIFLEHFVETIQKYPRTIFLAHAQTW